MNPFLNSLELYTDPQTKNYYYDDMIHEVIDYIQSKDKNLILDLLIDIRCGAHEEVIHAISQEYEITSKYMNLNSTKAYAQVVETTEGDVLALSNSLLLALFSDEASSHLSINIIHKKLCQIHNHFILNKNLGHDFINNSLSGWSYYLRPLSWLIWNNYFENRRSYLTLWNGKSEWFSILINKIPLLFNDITITIEKFKENKLELSVFINNLHSELTNLFSIVAYCLGTLAASKIPFNIYHNEFSEIVRNSYIGKIWDFLYEKLDSMYATYGHWDNAEVFSAIDTYLEQFLFEKFNITLLESAQDKTINISIY